MKKLKKLITSSICLMPWINISLKANGNYRLCCLINSDSSLRDNDNNKLNSSINNIDDIRNCYTLKHYRRLFLEGKKFKECINCWQKEYIGQTSKRIAKIKQHYKYTKDIFKYTKTDGTINIEEFPVLFYDLRLGNLCNAKCIICGTHNSSMFNGSFNEMEKNKILEEIKPTAKYIREIYFTGGEPLINNHHWEIIDYLIDNKLSKNIFIRYHTNGSIMKKEFINKWKQFKSVEVNFSIDGIEKTFEKIRTPLKWNKVESNIILFDKYSNETIYGILSPTLSNLNILEIPELINWFLNKNFKRIQKQIPMNLLYFPIEYSIKNQQYDEVYKKYKPYLNDHEYYKTVLKFMEITND